MMDQKIIWLKEFHLATALSKNWNKETATNVPWKEKVQRGVYVSYVSCLLKTFLKACEIRKPTSLFLSSTCSSESQSQRR